jgi:hypothetical protein
MYHDIAGMQIVVHKMARLQSGDCREHLLDIVIKKYDVQAVWLRMQDGIQWLPRDEIFNEVNQGKCV